MSLIKKIVTKLLENKVSKIDELYQKHAGEECYLFGDGVSLKWMDMDHFKDRTSILGGFMIYHKEVNKLKVPYATLIEPNWFWPIFPYGGFKKLKFLKHKMHQEYRKSVKSNPKILFFLNISNYPVTRFFNALYVSRWYKPPFTKNNPFIERSDAHEGTFKFQISLAIYLGYKKAYLIGHDYTHSPSKSFHFYEKGEGVDNDIKNFNKEFIDYAKQYIELVTITLDASSDVITPITYKEFTGAEPRFRENTEIVDQVKLQNLATWNEYLIY